MRQTLRFLRKRPIVLALTSETAAILPKNLKMTHYSEYRILSSVFCILSSPFRILVLLAIIKGVPQLTRTGSGGFNCIHNS